MHTVEKHPLSARLYEGVDAYERPNMHKNGGCAKEVVVTQKNRGAPASGASIPSFSSGQGVMFKDRERVY